MSDLTDQYNSFSQGRSWTDKVLEADQIWQQVKALLATHAQELPQTPRRPDIRLIINNNSGQDITFKNPGDHSGSKAEVIPGTGNKTAAMVMIKGDTLAQQYNNADQLFSLYDLGTKGLSAQFVADLSAGKINDLVDEAYGPAPLDAQAEKLVRVVWIGANGDESKIVPVHGKQASFGAREATNESVFLAQFHIYVKGSTTTAELVESDGMAIAVSSDWQTGVESTRPIVPSVAKVYYGEHFAKMPEITVHPDGTVLKIDLKNGTVLKLEPPSNKPAPKSPQP